MRDSSSVARDEIPDSLKLIEGTRAACCFTRQAAESQYSRIPLRGWKMEGNERRKKTFSTMSCHGEWWKWGKKVHRSQKQVFSFLTLARIAFLSHPHDSLSRDVNLINFLIFHRKFRLWVNSFVQFRNRVVVYRCEKSKISRPFYRFSASLRTETRRGSGTFYSDILGNSIEKILGFSRQEPFLCAKSHRG